MTPTATTQNDWTMIDKLILNLKAFIGNLSKYPDCKTGRVRKQK